MPTPSHAPRGIVAPGRPWGEWRDEWTIAPVTGAVA